jgi:hypothetical protein
MACNQRPANATSWRELREATLNSGSVSVSLRPSLSATIRNALVAEILRVEMRDVRLDETQPRIIARATAKKKNKKEASQPLHPVVVERLRAFLEARQMQPADKVFAPLFRTRGQIKRDLAAAGVARHDEHGRVADFHSLRHTFCTNLQRLGIPQRVLMHLMRHSDRKLSDYLYTDTSMLPANESVQKLFVPGANLSQIPSQELVPTGQTLSQPVVLNGIKANRKPLLSSSLRHVEASPVTSGHDCENMRDAGFEPATSCV